MNNNNIVMGILAHVDAGKTTLSEGLLYTTGIIRRLGRVDNKDAYLDNYSLERERGITIFSKQAAFNIGSFNITLLDTPGHVDFSAEMERTLQVLDYAILVISAPDGVQGHTVTLWKLLKRYGIPVFIFVNKMDQPGTEISKVISSINDNLDGNFVNFHNEENELYEQIALSNDKSLEEFLETGKISDEIIAQNILNRDLYPVFFGSALKLNGVEELINGMGRFMSSCKYKEEFAARIYKIGRDDSGNRLTYMKITGGSLKNRDTISYVSADGETYNEKVTQIRVYSGVRYESINEAKAGIVCAVTGLTHTIAGQGLGNSEWNMMPMLEPVLNYGIELPSGVDAAGILPKLRMLEEEDPQLHIVWNQNYNEIQIQVMGQVQLEVVKEIIKERYSIDVEFGPGKIVYKETISDTVEGVGHYEPLRHYAEVHLILEPLEEGSGLVFESKCSEDLLNKNWQRLILTHLEEKQHVGVLSGSAITDMKITLVAGRAHEKHTEGGDFRQATYRAVRHGLMKAKSVLLEPYYNFVIKIPNECVGRAMSDIERMYGKSTMESIDGFTILSGSAPVSTISDYQTEIVSYTSGRGNIALIYGGYKECHNSEEVIGSCLYNPENDIDNPCGSVFCSHGAGYVVPWYEVEMHQHIETQMKSKVNEEVQAVMSELIYKKNYVEEMTIDEEEINSILNQAHYANRKTDGTKKGWHISKRTTTYESSAKQNNTYNKSTKSSEAVNYLLVDGYNCIFAWDDLNEIAKTSIDGARGKLLDAMCNYQGIKKYELIVVFDAYRVIGHNTEIMEYNNIHVVYTKEAETADQYIEKFAHENGRKHNVTVATSDGLEQIIIIGQGCNLISARELQKDVVESAKRVMEDYKSYQQMQANSKNYVIHDRNEFSIDENN